MTIDDFLAHVDRSGGELACWPWTGARVTGGYGSVRFGGAHARPHRVAYELANGPIPEDLLVCHHCDNPPCCNPAHLFLGTQSDNMRDAYQKGRVRGLQPGHRPRKLTVSDVRAIRSASSRTQQHLASTYGVTQATISRVRRRLTWGHVA